MECGVGLQLENVREKSQRSAGGFLRTEAQCREDGDGKKQALRSAVEGQIQSQSQLDKSLMTGEVTLQCLALVASRQGFHDYGQADKSLSEKIQRFDRHSVRFGCPEGQNQQLQHHQSVSNYSQNDDAEVNVLNSCSKQQGSEAAKGLPPRTGISALGLHPKQPYVPPTVPQDVLPTACVTISHHYGRNSQTGPAPYARNSLAFWVLDILGEFSSFANIWRFPLLLHMFGGAFMYSTLLMYLVIGLPAHYLQLVIGQLTGVPMRGLLKQMGAAYGGLVIVLMINTLVSQAISLPFLAQSILYLYHSFTHDLPWATCDQSWALANCVSLASLAQGSQPLHAMSGRYSVEQFYLRFILRVNEFRKAYWFGLPDGRLCIIMIIVTVMCVATVLFIEKRNSDRSVVLALTLGLLPQVGMACMMIASFFLPGCELGLQYMFTVKLEQFANAQLWLASLGQVVVSLVINTFDFVGFGANRAQPGFQSMFLQSCLSMVYIFTSHLVNSILIFAVLGFLAHVMSTDVAHVVTGGPGFFFESFSAAAALLPHPTLASITIFFTLAVLVFTMQVRSQLHLLGVLMPNFARENKLKTFFTTIVFVLSISITLVTPGGYYITWILDFVAVCIVNNLSATLIFISIFWIHGMRAFKDFLEVSVGCNVKSWAAKFWYVYAMILPGLFIFLFGMGLVDFCTNFVNDDFPKVVMAPVLLYVHIALTIIFGGAIYGIVTSPGVTARAKFRNAFRGPLKWLDNQFVREQKRNQRVMGHSFGDQRLKRACSRQSRSRQSRRTRKY